MTQYAIVTDLNRCVGCMGCTVACKVANGVSIGSYWEKLLRIGPTRKANYVHTNDVEMYYLPIHCQHCVNPPCVSVCPTGASQKMDDGTVQIDKEQCIGCQACMGACPYGVRYLNEDEGVVEKCTLCEQLLSQGGMPQCVEQCGGRARFFGDLDKGIDSFEAPAIQYDADRESADHSYESQFKGSRITLGELAEPYTEDDVYTLDDAGNGPAVRYILRNREWKDGVSFS